MTRVRTDNVFGTTTDNPLLIGATTINSAGLANLAAVSSAEALIIIDPLRTAGAPEIVVVTAHTAAATSATIQRGQFGTTARQHAAGTLWVHGPVAGNASTYATAADDQGDFLPMNAWETYTPTLTQSGAVTKTVTYAKFVRLGRLIIAQVALTCTGSGTGGQQVRIGLPVTPAATDLTAGAGRIYDASANLIYGAVAHINTTSTFFLVSSSTDGADVLGAVAFTAALASGDIVTASIMYEAAS